MNKVLPTILAVLLIATISIGSLKGFVEFFNHVINPAQASCREASGAIGWAFNTCPEENGFFPDRKIDNLLAAIFSSFVITVLATYFACAALKVRSVFTTLAITATLLYAVLFVLVVDLRHGVFWR